MVALDSKVYLKPSVSVSSDTSASDPNYSKIGRSNRLEQASGVIFTGISAIGLLVYLDPKYNPFKTL